MGGKPGAQSRVGRPDHREKERTVLQRPASGDRGSARRAAGTCWRRLDRDQVTLQSVHAAVISVATAKELVVRLLAHLPVTVPKDPGEEPVVLRDHEGAGDTSRAQFGVADREP